MENNKLVILEYWKDIKGFENIYQISSVGNVKSLGRVVINNGGKQITKERILKPFKMKNGYIKIHLSNNTKIHRCLIHRLVACAFIENIKNKKCVNHKNSIRDDNRVENLEWSTHKENTIHGFKHGLICRNSISIEVIGTNVATKDKIYFKSMREAERNGFQQSSISSCVLGKQKKHRGYTWKRK